MSEEKKDISPKKKKNATVINRYGFIVMILSIVFILVAVWIVRIMFVEGDMWRELGKRETIKTDRIILPNRGNIYASDGRLLATSEPLYGIYMDFLAEGIRQDTLMKYVDDLSAALANKFKDKSAAQYKKVFMDNWNLSRKELAQIQAARASGSKERVKTKTRYVRIINRDINYLELKEVRTFPFFNQRSNKSGMIEQEKTMRKKPFGRLAGRTIGSIYKEIEMGGASGIELKYDSLLRGEEGIKSRQKVQGRWVDIVEVPAKDGIDIKTTIDIDIQDVVENALYKKLVELDAESGCAVIMEVETGEVKAISNLDRVREGVYTEGNPNTFSYMSEPGSTFKTVSLLVALEDGIVTPQDSFYVGNGLYQYNKRWIRDHYWRRGQDRGYMTVAEGIHVSSNVVVAKMILKGYENDPRKYVQRIYDTGLTKKIDWDVPLKGKEGTVAIRFPDDKTNHWSKTTLPWMSFGYETQVPPIYMLMFYNAIANGGKMIKPFFTKAFMKDGKVIEEFETEVINPSICSDRTLQQIHEILKGVVTDGTAKAVASESFEIAGKTGTALIASGGGYSGYFVSFCGYFPADKPKYTCFVGVRRPKGSPSGGLMPGAVFKNIAEEVYSHNVSLQPATLPVDSALIKTPKVKGGTYNDLKLVMPKLNLSFNDAEINSHWVKTSIDEENNIELKEYTLPEDRVPDVIGLGARDALYLLEKAGLKVGISGSGKVVSQSISAGSKANRGSYIKITLK